MFFLLFFLLASAYSQCPMATVTSNTNPKMCLKFMGTPSTWISADYQCNHLGGHLASVDSAFSNGFINGVAKNLTNAETFWLGKSRNFYSNDRMWSDGNNATYVNWALGEPNPGYDCLSQNVKDGKWHSQNCSSSLPYICEIPNVNSPCPDDYSWVYIPFTKRCYKFAYISYTDYRTNRDYCLSLGADLVSIHSYSENSVLGGFASNFFNVNITCLALGFYIDNNQEWAWADGSKVDFIFWDPRFPNKNDTTAYMAFNNAEYAVDNHWYSEPWDIQDCGQFVCQKDAIL